VRPSSAAAWSALVLLGRLPCSAAAQSRAQPAGPPGLVFLRGDRARVGAELNEVQDLMREFEKGLIANETPAHDAKIEDFFLMPTEVTNEQYARFLLAVPAHQPPTLWGKEAIDGAQAAFVANQDRAADEAKRAGTPFERQSFDRERWWDQNWRESHWRIPAGQEAYPVVDVDFGDAQGYARWAGLRLMTEVEFQYAVRGRTTHPYPWGSHWKKGAAATFEAQRDHASPVGSYPAGATAAGIYDLLGNVWEWTSTPYEAYDGFKPIKVEVTKGGVKKVIEGAPFFDNSKRVAVGGSYSESRLAARATTRGATACDETTEALGFRCAASARPGPDVAESLVALLPAGARARNLRYSESEAAAIERWDSEKGSVESIASYAVITSYRDVAFVPVERIQVAAEDALAELAAAQEGTVVLGLVHTSVDVAQPPLPPGTYSLHFKPKGRHKPPAAAHGEQDGESQGGGNKAGRNLAPRARVSSGPASALGNSAPAGASPRAPAASTAGPSAQSEPQPAAPARRAQTPAAYAVECDSFLFVGLDGLVAAAAPAGDIELEFSKEGSRMSATLHGAAAAGPGGEEAREPGDALLVTGVVKSANTSRSLVIRFELRFQPGVLAPSWRGL
jgi:formylglycine-generating enzyme required for sulfatase activity